MAIAAARWIVAANRFGMGAMPDEARRDDPAGWLKQQIERPDLPAALDGQQSTAEILESFYSAWRLAKTPEERRAANAIRGDAISREAEIRLVAAIQSKTSFVERWVWFWSNHFTVSRTALVDKIIGAIAGSYERETIRPNVFGRFQDLLVAVVKSPAMGLYLDNISSVGPNSPSGLRAKVGLNENLAREVMELHTLGVSGGYTQEDVKTLAAILTGWSFGKPGVGGKGAYFEFKAARHEPGEKLLLGVKYHQGGLQEGEAALVALAKHPSTARHIARKLAVHFVSDDPPQDVIDRLERIFKDTDGDLKALATAVIDMPEAWSGFGGKIRSPLEFIVAVHRAFGPPPEPATLVVAARNLLQTPFNAPSPQGWPDVGPAWMTPEGMIRRVDYSTSLKIPKDAPTPAEVMELALGSEATSNLKSAIAKVEPRYRYAIIFSSPEFQRR